MTCYTPQHSMMKLVPAKFHCNFPVFLCLECVLRMFSNAFQALLSVKFNFELKVWSSNICLICGPTIIPSFILVPLIFGNFLFKRQTLRFLNPLLLQIFWSNRAWYAVKINTFLTFPLKQDVPHSSDVVLFLNWVAIFLNSVMAVLLSAVPFTLKVAEFNVPVLQHSPHCCSL